MHHITNYSNSHMMLLRLISWIHYHKTYRNITKSLVSVLLLGFSIGERRAEPVTLQASDCTWFYQVSLHTKNPNNFSLRSGQAAEPGHASLVICPQGDLYHHLIQFSHSVGSLFLLRQCLDIKRRKKKKKERNIIRMVWAV